MLTLRRTYPDDERFWTVYSEFTPVGVINKPTGLQAWHWSITVQPARDRTTGTSANQTDAMMGFREAWEQYRKSLSAEQWAQHVAHMAGLAERAKQW